MDSVEDVDSDETNIPFMEEGSGLSGFPSNTFLESTGVDVGVVKVSEDDAAGLLVAEAGGLGGGPLIDGRCAAFPPGGFGGGGRRGGGCGPFFGAFGGGGLAPGGGGAPVQGFGGGGTGAAGEAFVFGAVGGDTDSFWGGGAPEPGRGVGVFGGGGWGGVPFDGGSGTEPDCGVDGGGGFAGCFSSESLLGLLAGGGGTASSGSSLLGDFLDGDFLTENRASPSSTESYESCGGEPGGVRGPPTADPNPPCCIEGACEKNFSGMRESALFSL